MWCVWVLELGVAAYGRGEKKQWVISLGGRQGSDQEGHAKKCIPEGF